MGFEFARPWAWLLLPVGIALVWLIDRHTGTRRKSRKLWIARVVRVVLLCLLVAALCGPAVLLPGNQAATWALVDLSASVAGQRAQMEAALGEGLQNASPQLMTGALTFGGNTIVDAPLAAGRTTMQLGTDPMAGSTDIGGALSMTLALLPEDTAGRIVLLSDGKDNAGLLQQQITALQGRGIPVDVLPIDSGFAADAQITSISPPAQVYEGERFDVIVRIDSLYAGEGSLVLYANREPVDTREVTLRKGENTFIFQDIAQQSGVVTYEAQLIAPGDENPRNNRLGAYMDVRGVPYVLIVGDGTELAPMLAAAGMRVETMLPGQLPATAEALRQYHAIALVNVNEDDLSEAGVAALDDYVRKLGRGLCVFGGDDSYAIGGYRGSKLEEMLPVTMDVDNRQQMPSLSLVLVIDKSGSMTEGRYGVTRLDMAKEAAMRSTEVLTARDNIGVIAFDDAGKWVVPMQKAEDVGAIQEMIGTIRPGGGTAYYSALAQALQALSQVETKLKHVIFLTDGVPGDNGYETIVQQMPAHDITMTTVGVGQGANNTLLRRMAEWGGGRNYETDEFDDIPKLFTKETFLATQAYVQNRRFFPVVWSSGALTNFAAFPALDGYLTTTARPLATVALATDQDEPLLAWWQYGAGRVLAWTSDTRGAWTGDLLRWSEAPAFFAGMVSHVLPTEAGEGELAVTQARDSARLVYTIPEEDASLTTTAIALAPDGTQIEVPLSATAPGVYDGSLPTAQEGAYAVRIEQRDGDDLVRTLESGVTVGYSAEYDLRTPDGTDLLREIALTTGGRLLTDASELFTEQGIQVRGRREITTPLLIAALILFVLDAAQRRLAWERLLPQRSTGTEAVPEAAKLVSKPPRPRKPAKTPKEDAPPEAKPTETAGKLLEGRKKKLM